ncbi:MAG: hypothetical protein IKX32_03175 [Bacteroidales bacterium]|nr:hypothetical protein [Bacteroidales bacterium]
MKRLTLLLLFAALLTTLSAQEEETYKFIRYDANVLHYDSNAAPMASFFDRWQRMAATGSGNLNIVHIGGSHVQAGTLPNTIRCRLMQAYPNLVGSRGMIFPYSAAAKCNNPADYRVHCVERMALTRCVHKEHACPLGLCGIAVTASDSLAEVQIVMNEPSVDYASTRVVVLGHSDQEVVPLLRVDDRDIYPSYVDPRTDRFVYNLSRAVDSFVVMLPCQEGQQFTLTGIYLGNRRAGITYSSIGVNGAAVPDYLRCRDFVRDLRLLHPDLVVFGIGINDASGPNFDTAVFRRNYLQLIDSIRTVNPDCAFVFVTNNDSFRKVSRRKYNVNTNGPLAREVFYRLAEETGGAVWDQFDVMGGLKSMDLWRQAKLAQKDRVHFTAAGYRLVGNLFADALLKSFADYTEALKQSSNQATKQ